MLRPLAILVLLYYLSLRINVASCYENTWVDPNDVHSHEHSLKKSSINNEHGSERFQDPMISNMDKDSKSNPSCQQKLYKCKKELEEKGCEERDQFLVRMLQRQVSAVLQAAGLMEEAGSTKKTELERLISITASREQLADLLNFVNSGKLQDFHELDETWSNMFSPVHSPGNVLSWNNWSSQSMSYSETYFWLLEIGVVLAPILMIALGMPISRVICILVLLTILTSGSLLHRRKMQGVLARQQHMAGNTENIPKECLPPSQNAWFFEVYFSHYDEEKCNKFYEAQADPITQMLPHEMALEILGGAMQIFSGQLGTSIDIFFTKFSGNLWWPLNQISSLIFKLLSIIVFVLILVLVLYICFTGRLSMPRSHHDRRPHFIEQPSQHLNPIEQLGPQTGQHQIHIHNRGQITINRGESDLGERMHAAALIDARPRSISEASNLPKKRKNSKTYVKNLEYTTQETKKYICKVDPTGILEEKERSNFNSGHRVSAPEQVESNFDKSFHSRDVSELASNEFSTTDSEINSDSDCSKEFEKLECIGSSESDAKGNGSFQCSNTVNSADQMSSTCDQSTPTKPKAADYDLGESRKTSKCNIESQTPLSSPESPTSFLDSIVDVLTPPSHKPIRENKFTDK